MSAKRQSPAEVDSGSPAGEPLYLVVGFLRRPHGVHGEIIMELHTDFPERLKPGRRLLVGEKHTALTIGRVRPYANGLLVKFRETNTLEDAGQYRNQWVYIKTAEASPLPAGRVYQHQLLGMSVFDDEGTLLGKLTEIIETGANDVYVVTNEAGKEILLPAIPSVILDLDPARRLIRVHLLEGLA